MSLEQETDSTTEQTTNDEQESSLAAFTAGLTGKDTEPPPPDPEEAAAKEQESAPPAPKYVQITEAERDLFLAAAQRLDALQATAEKNASTAFGKIGGIERRINEFGSRAIQVPKDKLDRLRGELPEIAEVFDALQLAGPSIDEESLVAKVREKLAPDDLVSQAEERAWKRFAEYQATRQHRDWKQVTASEEFGKFVKDKGDAYMAELAKAADEWDYETVCSAIGEFKKARDAAASEANAQRARMDSATAPRGRPAPPTPSKTAMDDYLAGLKQP